MEYLTHTLQTEFKVTCSASCRVVENRNGNLVAVTVARSHHSSFRRIRDVGLPLDKNTAFLKAAKNEKAIILNEIGQNEDQTYSSARDLDRYYRSTLFYPILGGNDYLLGFLSLDSPKRSAFTEPMLEIIQFYADWCRLLLLELSAGTNTEKMKPDNHMDPDVE